MEKLARKLKTIAIHWKSYVEVKERILALVENNSPYCINTEHWYYPERKMWVVKATLTMIESMESFTWLAQEIEWSWINATSALENAETSAVGRACAFAWIGVIDWIASVDEINKANNRTVDTPTWWTKPKTLTSTNEYCPECWEQCETKKGNTKEGKPYELWNCKCWTKFFVNRPKQKDEDFISYEMSRKDNEWKN